MAEWLALPDASQPQQQTAFLFPEGDCNKKGQGGGQNNGEIL